MKTVVAVLAAALAVSVPAASSATSPSSLAALGDSITRAFDTCSFPYIDCPSNSWSTGTNTSVASWYQRWLAVSPAIQGRAYNDAKTGAKMADLAGQASSAAAQQVDAVTILMGANDVCTSSVSTMTDPTVLAGQLRTALSTLAASDQNAQIYVASIPNVYHLWEIFHLNWSADFVWATAGICQSLLANPRSTSTADQARRAQVQQRVLADNAAIAQVCGEFAGRCHFDNGAAYNVVFTTSDVTTRDYFHPSVSGQAKAAAATWTAFFGG